METVFRQQIYTYPDEDLKDKTIEITSKIELLNR